MKTEVVQPSENLETDLARIRVRIVKGGKKRPIMFRRPSLKKVARALRRCQNEARSLRGALRRTGPLESNRQMEINNGLEAVAKRRQGVLNYVAEMTRPKPERK